MDAGTRTGIYFGLTSGVITTIGLVVGLSAGTQSITAVVGGIVLVAVADGLSDALGIHLAKESDHTVSSRSVWNATVTTFITKFVVALTFIVPVLLLPLGGAVIASVIWSLLVIVVLSYFIARSQGSRPLPIIAEHAGIALLVVAASHFIGIWVQATFGA
jgi:VIT1/CCC1 family predicted Fe2+/Mn2+ transporter